jgi:seryl-tRNA synthetase
VTDLWATIASYVLGPAGLLALGAGVWMAVIGARAKRDVATKEAGARIAEADARAMPSLLRRMEQQDKRIDALGGRLDECEEKHAASVRRGDECDEKHEAVLARAEQLEEHVVTLQAQLERQSADVGTIAHRLREVRQASLPPREDDTGVHELERIVRKSPTPERAIPAVPPRPWRDKP